MGLIFNLTDKFHPFLGPLFSISSCSTRITQQQGYELSSRRRLARTFRCCDCECEKTQILHGNIPTFKVSVRHRNCDVVFNIFSDVSFNCRLITKRSPEVEKSVYEIEPLLGQMKKSKFKQYFSFQFASPSHRVYDEKTNSHTWDRVTKLEKGVIYYEGTSKILQDLTGWKGHQILYFGDHLYSDLADVTLEHGECFSLAVFE